MRELEIFRVGSWQGSGKGAQREWTAQDLRQLAETYDQAVLPAPITIGHTQDLPTTAPAYGWVESLVVRGDRLIARLSQVVPELVRLVREGYYKTRSIEIYPPGHPANPKPEGFYLKAVAFLGAQAPAVKGLADVQFSTTPALSYAEAVQIDPPTRGGGRQMKDFWKALRAQLNSLGVATPPLAHAAGDLATEVQGQEIYDLLNALYAKVSEIFDDAAETDKKGRVLGMVDELKTMIGALTFVAARAAMVTSFSAADLKAAADKAQADERKRGEREHQGALRRASIATFCEGLKGKGHLAPAWEKAGLATFLEQLGESDTMLTFAEGAQAQTPLAWMQGFLAALPKLIEFKEIAAAEAIPATPAFSEAQRAINRQLGIPDALVAKFTSQN